MEPLAAIMFRLSRERRIVDQLVHEEHAVLGLGQASQLAENRSDEAQQPPCQGEAVHAPDPERHPRR